MITKQNLVLALAQYTHDVPLVLIKDPEELLSQMTPELINRWHMLTGLFDEFNELQAAIYNNDSKNVTEELGDFMFYLMGYASTIQGEFKDNLSYITQTLLVDPINDVLGPFGVLKKHVVYAKDTPKQDQLDALRIFYNAVRTKVEMFVHKAQLLDNVDDFINEAIQANQEKLLTGTNARYSSGSYSDAQAVARKDKE
ncbi:MAG: hypothetical protein Tp152SUR00d2C52646391_37 [Prokaryotic dsDNA virus sp.]|nr:MAG: hypothetical protein Tp152SUR00d2C52646391_37 [Prokaryotic dsDNA virus sp.]|tara:strand:+ start:1013 stop:1606 length:594 start_codon:yes stop_codon:yes gene_type:complete